MSLALNNWALINCARLTVRFIPIHFTCYFCFSVTICTEEGIFLTEANNFVCAYVCFSKAKISDYVLIYKCNQHYY